MTVQAAEPQTKRWTREEYYQLAEAGWFRGQRVQLIDGEIIQMPPRGHPHAKALTAITRWLHNVFPSEFVIRIQMPLNVLCDSDPEPDAAVAAGPIEKYTDHPQTALLVIEVSDSSLALDRKKASLYATAGVQEYWLVDLEHRTLEARRGPVADASAPRGFRYESSETLAENDSISPLSMTQATLKISSLFT